MDPWTGKIMLRVEQDGERSILRDSFAQGALKIMQPLRLETTDTLGIYLLNLGGGYLDGDRYHLEIHVGERAHLLLTTQAATKIYRISQMPAYQQMDIYLHRGSVLEYLPDPIIAYAEARFVQQTHVYMEKGATFICAETITPGWSPDGHPFSYASIRSRLLVYEEGELVFFDPLRFEPDALFPGMGMMEGQTHFGSFLAIGDSCSKEFLQRVQESLETQSTEGRWGLSLLPTSGFACRVLARSTKEVEEIFAHCIGRVRELWLGDKIVRTRKY